MIVRLMLSFFYLVKLIRKKLYKHKHVESIRVFSHIFWTLSVEKNRLASKQEGDQDLNKNNSTSNSCTGCKNLYFYYDN